MEETKYAESPRTPLQTVFINGNKISTLIPNRIFVGGFQANTSEEELREFFTKFGEVKDVKIVPDKAGQSKGSYGFVTFESQEIAEKIIAEQADSLLFRDRKLNIGRAVKKQPLTAKSELPNTVYFNPLSLAYGSLYPFQDYSYLFNQDLSAMYQNYSSMLPQVSMLPSLLSPVMSSNEALGFSLNNYQQLQSLLPFSFAQQYPGMPTSTADNATTCVTDPFSIAALLSTNAALSTAGSLELPVTASSVTEESQETTSGSKVSHSSVANQIKDSTNVCDNGKLDNSCDEIDVPRKKIKYEESVTRSCDPVRYILPN